MEPASLIEEIRFGYGPLMGKTPSPGGLEPDRVLAQLAATDPAATQWDRPQIADRWALFDQYKQEKLTSPDGKGPTGMVLRKMDLADVETFVARPATAALGFVERLVNLWANRITISNATNSLARYMQVFRDGAIRPHIAGRYADMLKATLWHPGMQTYLTQTSSIGPNSVVGLRKAKGLNENLAREFLELHSMGTGYSQTDVTELARLLAGMVSDAAGMRMEPNRMEPGPKQILGDTYTDSDPVAEIDRLVETVAHRPETAQSVSFWLARHFIADAPPPDLVSALAATYAAHDTDLVAMYRTLLQHPAAASADRQKLRCPQEYMAASLRLLGMNGQEQNVPGFNKRSMMVPDQMAKMGQPVWKALRPDGWPEVAAGWMTPPMVAARIDWAVNLARAVGDRADPVALTDQALGAYATPLLTRAVAGAEQRWEGLAVLIASPDFSRR